MGSLTFGQAPADGDGGRLVLLPAAPAVEPAAADGHRRPGRTLVAGVPAVRLLTGDVVAGGHPAVDRSKYFVRDVALSFLWDRDRREAAKAEAPPAQCADRLASVPVTAGAGWATLGTPA